MTVTATELRKYLGKYLDLSQKEDIFIEKRKKVIAVLSSKHAEKLALVDSLVGILPKDVKIEEGKEEAIYRHEQVLY